MLAMALLLPGGHLGGLGGGAGGADGFGGALTPSTVPDGSRWGLEAGESAHLLRILLDDFFSILTTGIRPYDGHSGCHCCSVPLYLV